MICLFPCLSEARLSWLAYVQFTMWISALAISVRLSCCFYVVIRLSKLHLASPAGLPGCTSQQVSRLASSLQESSCLCFGNAWSYPAASGLQNRPESHSNLQAYYSRSFPFSVNTFFNARVSLKPTVSLVIGYRCCYRSPHVVFPIRKNRQRATGTSHGEKPKHCPWDLHVAQLVFLHRN